MSTPATFKKMEENKQRKDKVDNKLIGMGNGNTKGAGDLKPLSEQNKNIVAPRGSDVSQLGAIMSGADSVTTTENPRVPVVQIGDGRGRSRYAGNALRNQFQRPRRQDFTRDVTGGKQFTSFEGGAGRTRPQGPRRPPAERAPPAPLVPQTVAELPIDVDTTDYKIDPETMICFSGRTNFLSNLYATPVLIDGHEYSSVEHYYQACKLFMLGGADLAAQIRRVNDAGSVKSLARKLLRNRASSEQLDEWKKKQSLSILKHAIAQKFVQHAQLREKLLATGDGILAHTYDRDNLFATGCGQELVEEWAKKNAGNVIKVPNDLSAAENVAYVPLVGQGKNLLGAINMQIREALREWKRRKDEGLEPVTLEDPALNSMYDSLKSLAI